MRLTRYNLYSYANGTLPKEKATTTTLSPSSISVTRTWRLHLHRNGAKACNCHSIIFTMTVVELVIRSQAGMTDEIASVIPTCTASAIQRARYTLHTHRTFHFWFTNLYYTRLQMSLIKSTSGTRGTIGGRPGEGLSPLRHCKIHSRICASSKKTPPVRLT